MTENYPGNQDGRPDGGHAPGPDTGASPWQRHSDAPPGAGGDPHQAEPDSTTRVTINQPPVYRPDQPRPPEQQPSGPIPVAQVPTSSWAPGQPTGSTQGATGPTQELSGQPGQPAQPANPMGPTQSQTFGPATGPAAYPQGQQPGYPRPGVTQPSVTQPSATPPGASPTFGGFGPPTNPSTAAYTIGGLPQDQPRKRSTGLIIGVAILALVLGGAAGGLGGYLVSSNNNSVVSSLDQPLPASQASNAPAGSVQAVATKVLPVVVTIAAEFQSQGNLAGDTGSGFIISSTGDILTNNHVIADAATGGGRIQVIFANGRTVDATIVGRDPTTDIAVIKAQGVSGLPIAQLGSSNALSVGQEVVAIGAPFELAGTVTSGIVSSLHRPTAAGDGGSQTTVLDAIQTDAPINPGNSGGPLVNMQGQVVGMNSAIYSPNSGDGPDQSQGGNVGIGFAIPIDQARRTADEIVKTGKATQTVLGVGVNDNTPTQNGEPSILPDGALIKTITPNGPAAKAGLQAGSVVVKANNRPITSADGLVAAVHAASPGDKMALTLANGTVVTVTLGGQTVNPN